MRRLLLFRFDEAYTTMFSSSNFMPGHHPSTLFQLLHVQVRSYIRYFRPGVLLRFLELRVHVLEYRLPHRLKICVFLHHQKDLIHLNQHLSARFLDDLQNKAYQSHVLARLPAFSELFYSLTYTIGSTAFLTTILIPLLALRHGKYIQVCPSIFPFEYAPGGLVYWLLQLTEALAAFFVWAVTSGVDSAFGLYTLQMCGELRILGSKFESLRVSDKYREELRECIERHHLLMKARDSMEKTFGLLAIWLAVSSAVIQCTLVFQAMEVAKSMNPLRIGFFFLYIVLKLLQAFMYAWYGNLIAEESAMCLNAIYNARWAGCGNSRFMTDVLIILSQKPLVFTAKGCVSLKMEIFSKIVNTSVSYFFLLRTLDEGSQN